MYCAEGLKTRLITVYIIAYHSLIQKAVSPPSSLSVCFQLNMGVHELFSFLHSTVLV